MAPAFDGGPGQAGDFAAAPIRVGFVAGPQMKGETAE